MFVKNQFARNTIVGRMLLYGIVIILATSWRVAVAQEKPEQVSPERARAN
jgi:hypothetical protein